MRPDLPQLCVLPPTSFHVPSHNGQFGKSAAPATRADCYWGWVTRLRYQPVNLYGPTGARTVTASRTLGDDRGFEETSQVYYNEFAQIRMARWSRGRVVLAGDAAHCASPFTEVEETRVAQN
jgi:2-polyprenyl-6-methoxyphenol hydroxylase-like FAD-dependent oxidoreductase